MQTVGLLESLGQERAQDGDRLRGDDREQPCSRNALIQSGLGFLDGNGDKEGIGQSDPEEKSENPKPDGDLLRAGEQDELIAQDARSRH